MRFVAYEVVLKQGKSIQEKIKKLCLLLNAIMQV
jgi:hypothetical protein